MKTKFFNLLYAIVLQIVIMPVLGCFTYFLYDKYTYLNIEAGYSILFFLLIVFLVALNLFCLYYLAKTYYSIYKMPIQYYFIIGLFTCVFVSWFKIYYYLMEKVNCKQLDSTNCLDSFVRNNSASVILVLTIAYFIIFILLYNMIKTKKKIKNKKQ